MINCVVVSLNKYCATIVEKEHKRVIEHVYLPINLLKTNRLRRKTFW